MKILKSFIEKQKIIFFYFFFKFLIFYMAMEKQKFHHFINLHSLLIIFKTLKNNKNIKL